YAGREFSTTSGYDWLRLLLEWLVGFLNWIAAVRAGSPVIFWLLVVVCVVLLALVLAHLAWTIRRIFVLQTEPHGPDAAAGKRQRLSGAYWEEARKRAAQQDYTEAIRNLFLSLVYRFDESGRVSFQRAWT